MDRGVIILFLVLAVLAIGYEGMYNINVPSGHVKPIPFSDNTVVGTDSTIVFIDGDGKVVSVINRHGACE